LDYDVIGRIFKLLTKGTTIFTRDIYHEEVGEYFEGGKEEHYKQDLGYIINKTTNMCMQIHFIIVVEVSTFKQGKRFARETLLLTINAVMKGQVN
jgi:hypothetical protein